MPAECRSWGAAYSCIAPGGTRERSCIQPVYVHVWVCAFTAVEFDGAGTSEENLRTNLKVSVF